MNAMQNHYLKAVDKAALRAALLAGAIVIITDDGDQIADGYCLDEIGVIYKPTGQLVDVEGVAVTELAAAPGWHANLLGELSAEQVAALGDVLLPVPPANPYRVWAEAPPPEEVAPAAEEPPAEALP